MRLHATGPSAIAIAIFADETEDALCLSTSITHGDFLQPHGTMVEVSDGTMLSLQ